VLAVHRGQRLVAVGRHGEPPNGDEEAWREATALATERSDKPRSDPSQLASRGEDTLSGPVLAVKLRGRDVSGALYADKYRRAGQFRDQDHAVAHLLGEYISLALGRLQAHQKESFALHQLAVTLDAIRDGVLACDERGVVTSVNAAAARMLRVDHDALLGARLDRIPSLGPLHALVGGNARLDGAVVRLPHGSVVVTSRPIGGEDDEGRGFVATLVELDRAHKIAQRLSATRARYDFHDIIGTSASLHTAIAMAKRAANADASVLITGESGTGKEVIAQAIHTAGPRATEPFVGINVAALPRELLEAELFGYEKGAFTGARSEGNPGKFELAGEGTVLLDEIGDMPLDMQAKLLRVLQERVVTRLGARQEIPMQARVIATTHRDLEQLVDEGKFRMDLLYRLRVLAVEMPPLRDRPEDIAPLAKHHLLRFAELQRKRVREIGPKVREEMERYDWPGNVRELANVMEAEVSLIAPDVDVLERLATRLIGRFRTPGTASTGEWRTMPPAPLAPQDQPILPLHEVEKKAFLHALDRCQQNVARAAEALGVSKVTFYAKLRSWGMHPKDRGEDDGPTSARWSTRMRAADALAQTGANPIAVAVSDDEPPSRGGGPDTPKSRT
jgi:transcriptional regulator with PAS, ATPase and Fis domain